MNTESRKRKQNESNNFQEEIAIATKKRTHNVETPRFVFTIQGTIGSDPGRAV